MTEDEKIALLSQLAANGTHIGQVNFGDGYQYYGCTINPKAEPSPKVIDTIEAEDVEEDKTEQPQTDVSKFFRVDKTKLEDCQNQFKEIITTSKTKQGALGQIRHMANSMYFNPNTFTHQALADELNRLQSKFHFIKADIDSVKRKK